MRALRALFFQIARYCELLLRYSKHKKPNSKKGPHNISTPMRNYAPDTTQTTDAAFQDTNKLTFTPVIFPEKATMLKGEGGSEKVVRFYFQNKYIARMSPPTLQHKINGKEDHMEEASHEGTELAAPPDLLRNA